MYVCVSVFVLVSKCQKNICLTLCNARPDALVDLHKLILFHRYSIPI